MSEDQSGHHDASSEQNPRMSEFVLKALKKKENQKEKSNDEHPSKPEAVGAED